MRKFLLVVTSFVLVGMMAPWSHSHGLVSADLARVAASLAAYSTSMAANQAGPRSPAALVEEGVLDALAVGQRPDVLVRFAGQADLSAAGLMRNKQARGEFTVNALTTHADALQHGARQTLQAFGRQPAALEDVNGYQVLWLVNAIAVKAISQTELEALASDPNVVSIEQQVVLPPLELDQEGSEGSRAPASHIAHINAPAVWDLGYTGEGIVVSNTDSGVRHTHAALVNQYRGNLGGGTFNHNHNWFDPYNFSAAPRNSGDHGTHVMGTSVGDDGGDNQIGVAPGASWMACIGFGGTNGGASNAGLIACGQFAIAPTDTNGNNPDPSRAAHVVNNSWGGTVCNGVVDPWYEGVIDGWIAAGIVPVFSMGNASNCQFPNNPPVGLNSSSGNLAKSFSIGSSGTNNTQVAPHTIKGPTRNIHPGTTDLPSHFGFPTMKPNVVAPGVGIRSSVASGDANYGNSNGTSMSAPAVAGLVALMWDAADCLIGDYATTGNLIITTARPIPVATGSNADGIDNVPNVATGWGEIDALAAVQAAIAHCDAPAVTGPQVRATRVINFEVEAGQSTTADLLIENIGIGALTWSTSEAPASCASGGDVAWLSVGTTSGSVAADGSQNVVVTANAAGLAAGNQGARLCLANNDSDNGLVEIKVNLVVRPVGFVAPFPAPYCAVHTAATPTIPVSRVVFAGIDNASPVASGSPLHEDFTAQIAQVEAGQVLPFRVELNTLGGNNFGVGVYVDWNNDGDLGIEELTVLGFLSGSTGTDGQNITANLTIPADAAPGDYRMRVLSRFAGAGNSQPINSCGTVNGQGEDYTLRVIGSGGGTDPLIAVDPDSIAFTLAAGTSGSESLSIGNVGGGTLNWNLLDPVTLANSRGTALIDEGFEGSFPPSGWTALDQSTAAGVDCAWKRSDSYPMTGLSASVGLGAGIDADDCGTSGMAANSIDTSLITPAFDLSTATQASVNFDFAYRHLSSSRVDLDVSTDGGSTWTLLNGYSAFVGGGASVPPAYVTVPQDFDLSAYAGQSDVRLRWRFVSDWDWFAFVDNVVVTANTGGEPPGNCWTPGSTPWLSASPTNGALAGPGNQAVALTANATGLAAGNYDTTLCVSSNDSAGNTAVEVPVTLLVTAGGGADPLIAVAPTALSFSVAAGGSDSDDLAISNIGGGTLDWSIATAEGSRVKPLNLSRAARTAQTVQGTDLRFTGSTSAAPAEQRIRHVPVRGGDPITVRVLTPDATPAANLVSDLNAFPDIEASLHTGVLASLTVNDLLPFDVVAINNNNRWSTVAGNDVLVGNVLADYVDAGGKVVVFNYAFDNVGWGLAGRFISGGYGPFQLATNESSPSVTMNVVNAKHPIFDGVGAVSSTGLIQTLPVNPNAELLASWSNGWAMIAANANTVGFNLLYGPATTWTGDVDVLVHNAIVWLVGGGSGGVCQSAEEVSWLTVATTSGSTAGGQADSSTISVSGAGLAAGSYQARLCVSSNDSAGNELVNVPVTLTVAGGGSDPIIALTPTALDFSVDSGDSDSDALSIGNVGGGTLTWSIQTTETTRASVDLSRPAQPAIAARSTSAGARSAAAITSRPAEHRVRTLALRGGDPVSVLVVSPDGEISDPPDFPAPPQNLVDDLNAFPDTTATLYTGALASVTAAAFQPFDVVIISNNGQWAEVGAQTSVGNALADYVDGGGKVVVFNFAYDFFGWELGGRFITENYGPFQQATGDSTDAASMVVVQADHPIFDGAKSVTQPDGFFRLDTALTSGSQVLANWSDGLPFIAANDNSVAFNILYGADPSWSGDLDILVHNAVIHLAGSSGPQPGACGAPTTVSWLNVGTVSGSTAAGTSGTSTITVNTTGLAAGSYQAALCVASNDPVNPQVEVPVTLTVTGDPPITDRIFCDGFENGGDGSCGGGSPGDPDLVIIENLDWTPAADGTGGSIQWIDGTTCACDTAPFNFNPYQAGGSLLFFWPLNTNGSEGGVTLNGTAYAVLQSGATIGASSQFMVTAQGAATTALWANADGYLGFRFLDGGMTKYGYARITTGAGGRPFTLHSITYNNVGDPITIP